MADAGHYEADGFRPLLPQGHAFAGMTKSEPAVMHLFPSGYSGDFPSSQNLIAFPNRDFAGHSMTTVDANKFHRDFGYFQIEAQREPIRVTSHGKVIGGFLSAQDLEHYERLKRRERQGYVAGGIPDEIIAAIEKAEYLKPPS